jgi:CheY-like chemotaxis protein
VLAAAELLNATDLDHDQRGKLDMIRRSSGALLGVVQEMIELDTNEPPEELCIDPLPEVPAEAETELDPRKLVDVEAQALRRAVLIVRSEELLGRLTALLQHDSIQSIALETVDLAMSLVSDGGSEAVKADFVMSDDAHALKVLNEWAQTILPANRPTIIDLNKVMTEGYAPVKATAAPAAAPANAAPVDESNKPAPAKVSIRELMRAPGLRVEPRSLPSVAETLVAQEAPNAKRKKLPLDLMVVEDNDVNQIVYDQLLGSCGYQYLIVSTGEEGVNTATREKPRLILMDISMPGLNGLEATRRLRALAPNKRPVIVGMTSHLLAGDREKCLAAGMDDYALKPTSSGPLRAQLADWIGLMERAEQAAS